MNPDQRRIKTTLLALAFCLAANLPAVAQNNGLLTHLRFDESSGLTASDSQGFVDGELSTFGAEFVANGIAGNAISLNRSFGAYVLLRSEFAFTNSDFSLCAWIKTTTASLSTHLFNRNSSDTVSGYTVGLNSQGNNFLVSDRAFFIAGHGGVLATTNIPTSTTSLTDDQWHFVVATYEIQGTNSARKRMYIDGQLESEISFVRYEPSGAHLLLGGSFVFGQPTGAYAGLMDEVQIYDRALSPSEVGFLHQNPGHGAPPTNLPPVIVQHPTGGGWYTNGANVTLSAAAAGSDLKYQWLRNGQALPGATDNPLQIINANPFDRGVYALVVSNDFGAVTSRTDKVVLPNSGGLLLHWRFDEGLGATQAFDEINQIPASLTNGAVFDVGGRSTNALRFDYDLRSAAIVENVDEELRLDARDYTFSAWIRTSFEDNFNVWVFTKHKPGSPNGYAMVVNRGLGDSPHTHKASFLSDTTGFQDANALITTNDVTDDVWHHIAVTHRINGTKRIYMDGQVHAELPINGYTHEPWPFVIGNSWNGGSFGNGFDGLIDELQIYDRALSDDEIAILFQNPGIEAAIEPVIYNQPHTQALLTGTDFTLSALAQGREPLFFQWLFNDEPIPGETNIQMQLVNAQPNQSGYYRLRATNLLGTNFTTNFYLNINDFGAPQYIVNERLVLEPEVTVIDRARVSIRSAFLDTGVVDFQYTADGSDPRHGIFYPTNQILVFTNTFVPLRATALSIDAQSPHFNQSAASELRINVLPEYDVLVASPGGGSVLVDRPGTRHVTNTLLNLTATPNDGWQFTRWAGDLNTTDNPAELRIDGPKNVHAVFAAPVNVTNFSGSHAYHVEPTNALHEFGSVVRVTAIPDPGFYLRTWSFDAANTLFRRTNTLHFVMNVDEPSVDIGALFEPLPAGQVSLAAVPVGGGFIDISPALSRYEIGTQVTLTPRPDPDFVFAGWSGAVTNSLNPLTLTLDSSMVITGRFLVGQAPIATNLQAFPGGLREAFKLGDDIPLEVTAFNDNDTVQRVEFFANGVSLGANTARNGDRFFFTWTGAPTNDHRVTARAVDDLGVVGESRPLIVSVQSLAPFVSFSEPAAETSFTLPTNVVFRVNAFDNDGIAGRVGRVELYENDHPLGTNFNPVGALSSFTWTNPPAGRHRMRARVYDLSGDFTDSAILSLTVVHPPGTPTFHFGQSEYVVDESAGTLTVTVVKNFSQAAQVNVISADSSATNAARVHKQDRPGDYHQVAQLVRFGDNVQTQALTIQIVDDPIREGPQEFLLQLLDTETIIVTNPAVARVTIRDDTDTPQTTNSLLDFVGPFGLPENLGSLTLNMTAELSAGVRTNVGQWRLAWDPRWQGSGQTLNHLQAGEYFIEFKQVDGFISPPVTNITLPGFDPITLDVEYTYDGRHALEYASVTAQITGGGGNGRWRVQGGDPAWRQSGERVDGLLTGPYVIEFADVEGFHRPTPQPVRLHPGSRTVTAAYVAEDLSSRRLDPVDYDSTGPLGVGNGDPFPFVGQLLSENGYGSGSVVKSRVVLTAAHVVFDDRTLGWATNVWWFHRRYAGENEPVPVRPRGWYFQGGYDVQRGIDSRAGSSSAGTSTVEAQARDVATLYFFEPAAPDLSGLGGFGGFLVSDDTLNYLSGQNQKQLVGYPMDSPATLSEQHQPRQSTRSIESILPGPDSRVHLTSRHHATGGASGGPLCVRVGDRFYPAGIFLGGDHQRANIRLLDGDVAVLINRAEFTSLTGDNNSSGGLPRRPGLPVPQPPPGFGAGGVQVRINADALAAGAGWQIVNGHEVTFFVADNEAALLRPQGTNLVRFRDATGFITPADTYVRVAVGLTNELDAFYLRNGQLLNAINRGALGNGVRFNFSGSGGREYVVYGASNLTSTGAVWIALETNTFGLNGQGSFTDPDGRHPGFRFFRTAIR